jgi:bifunctional non-homologous end joining protein LigD
MGRRARVKQDVTFTNVDKVFFPATGFNKGDLIRYYIEVAAFLLPHFRDRPVTLIRMPDGVKGERFYEKNAPGHTPEWVSTTQVPRSEGGVINYILINDPPTLAWCANNAAIELHPFLHRADDLRRPTHLAFDLDPGEGADLLTCIEVGFMVKAVLDGLGLEAFPKVSGSKGLQLYVPLNTAITYDTVTPFAKAIAELLHERHPDLIVSDMLKALRVGRVFIDWSQNHEKKTTVGAYSVRGKRDEPFVSMPVTWQEMKRVQRTGKMDALFFSPAEALQRVRRRGDPFAPVLALKQRLPGAPVTLPATKKPAPRSLRRYAEMRDFDRTPEPAPAVPTRSRQGSRRRFVIQKHAASHLHYDFRIEMHEVLKSWAVPKGLSPETGVRRSAFQTEDHPLEYFDFEGTIPEGEYGGGTVMVWDIGTYDVVDGNYWKGELRLWLSGRKLKGEWQLTRQTGSDADKPRWVIEKVGKTGKRITAKADDTSARSGLSMQQIATGKGRVWHSHSDTTSARKPKSPAGAGPTSLPRPEFVEPMTARLVSAVPSGAEWIYEIKLDGYRAFGIKHGGVAHLLSRKNNDLGSDFPQIGSALTEISADTAMLDGEIVALDAKGRPSFQLLQNRKSAAEAVVYYAFDLLHLNGEDWRKRPLTERKAMLEKLVAGTAVRFSAGLEGERDAIVAAVGRMGLEGIVAKRRDSVYESGERSGAWVKFKLSPEQEFVVGGYKRGTPLESLVVGYYEDGKLMCAGKVRQGLNPVNRRQLHTLFRRLQSEVCPFANLPNSRKSHWGEGITREQMAEIQWLEPNTVAQVSFTEWTSGGNLRHATFKGLRTDKLATDVVREG